MLVAPNRNKLIHSVLWAGPGCTHFVALYCLFMKHVTPSSGKENLKRHMFSFLLVEGRVC